SVEISARPFLTQIHPSRVTPGTTAKLDLIGYNLPANATVNWSAPANLPEGPQLIELPLPDGSRANPAPVVVSRLPEIREIDGDKSTRDKAQPIAVPSGVAGRLATEAEIDTYVFEAVKGQRYSFQVVARSNLSPLDSLLRLYNA